MLCNSYLQVCSSILICCKHNRRSSSYKFGKLKLFYDYVVELLNTESAVKHIVLTLIRKISRIRLPVKPRLILHTFHRHFFLSLLIDVLCDGAVFFFLPVFFSLVT